MTATNKEVRRQVLKVLRMSLNGAALSNAIDAMNNGMADDTAPVKVPKAAIKKLSMILGKSRRAVVVVGKKNKIKVYSLDGHRKAGAATRRHKPWTKVGGSSKKVFKLRIKKRIHWTHKPENKAKVAALVAGLKAARAAAK